MGAIFYLIARAMLLRVSVIPTIVGYMCFSILLGMWFKSHYVNGRQPVESEVPPSYRNPCTSSIKEVQVSSLNLGECPPTVFHWDNKVPFVRTESIRS